MSEMRNTLEYIGANRSSSFQRRPPMIPGNADTNKRASNRSAYPACQLVAFHEESQSPSTSMFAPVRCRDISTCGIAFFVPTASGHSVLYGGTRQRGKDHSRPLSRGSHEPAWPQNGEWLIGCQFLDRSDQQS